MKINEIITEASDNFNPGRRKFMQRTAGAAAMAAAPQQTMKSLGQMATAATTAATTQAAAAKAAIAKELWAAAIRYVGDYEEDPDEEWDEDAEELQGTDGTTPWNEFYEINTTPKGREYLHTATRYGRTGVFTYNDRGQIYTLELSWEDGGYGEVIDSDQHNQEDIYALYDQNPSLFDQGHEGELIDAIIDMGTIGAQPSAPSSAADVAIDVAQSATSARQAAGGLAAFQNLLQRVLGGDKQQSPSPDQVEKSATTTPALPAPDKTATDIMRDLQNRLDRPLTDQEKEIVNQKIKKETVVSKEQGVREGSHTTEKQILTRIRQIMYDRKLSGTDSNAGELLRLKQKLKDIRNKQGVSEG